MNQSITAHTDRNKWRIRGKQWFSGRSHQKHCHCYIPHRSGAIHALLDTSLSDNLSATWLPKQQWRHRGCFVLCDCHVIQCDWRNHGCPQDADIDVLQRRRCARGSHACIHRTLLYTWPLRVHHSQGKWKWWWDGTWFDFNQARAASIAKSLVSLVSGANLGDITCMAELVWMLCLWILHQPSIAL